MKFYYLLPDIAMRTKYPSVRDAYERNLAEVVRYRDAFYIEGHGCSDRTYRLIIRETKRLYPDLTYLFEGVTL